MRADLFRAVAQIREKSEGPTCGTGFLVAAGGIMVTCAHVLPDGPDSRVWVEFSQLSDRPGSWADVVDGTWRNPEREDVAFLRLVDVPVDGANLPLRATIPSSNCDVLTYGFPAQAPAGGHRGRAILDGVIRDTANERWLVQLREANDLAVGFSGAPLVDEQGLVVGMVSEHAGTDVYSRGQNIAYATPISVLQRVFPDIRTKETCPYPGLEPFSSDQGRAGWFHGRTELKSRLRKQLESAHGMSLLLGPSGSGKTSLVTAGLLPDLDSRPLVTPSGTLMSDAVIVRPSNGLRELYDTVRRIRQEPLLVIVDQFEELFAISSISDTTNSRESAKLADDDLRPPPEELIDLLLEIARGVSSDPSAGWVLIVVRDDFYHRLGECGLLALLKADRRLDVPDVLSITETQAAIVEPARAQGWIVDPVLTAQLIADIANPRTGNIPATSLPLLALVLRQLWDRALVPHGRTEYVAAGPNEIDRDDPVPAILTADHYAASGGLPTAIGEFCDHVLDEFSSDDKILAQNILTALVLDGDIRHATPVMRRRLTMHELADVVLPVATSPRSEESTVLGSDEELDAVRRIVQQLTVARLLTTTHPRKDRRDAKLAEILPTERSSYGSLDDNNKLIEIIHDAIVNHWDSLRDWLAEDRDHRTWLQEVLPRAHQWQIAPGPVKDDLLMPESRFGEARRMIRERPAPRIVRDYVSMSQQVNARRKISARRRYRILIISVVLSICTACSSILAASVAGWQWSEATARQRELTEANLSAQARAALEHNPPLAQLYALAALERKPDASALSAAETVLTMPLGAPKVILTGHTDHVNAVAWSPDGTRLATASDDHTARIWDSATGRAVASLTGHTDMVEDVAWSPDGSRIATGSADGTARLWDPRSGRTTATFNNVATFSKNSLTWSPDGTRLAIIAMDHTVQVWNPVTTRQVTVLRGHRELVNEVAWSPDGAYLATASDDDTARVWDSSSGRLIRTLTEHGSVYSVRWRPKTTMLAVDSIDGIEKVWDPISGRSIGANISAHGYPDWSPDGRFLAVPLITGSVRVWDVDSNRQNLIISGTDFTGEVRWSPQGALLAVESINGTVRIFDPYTGGIFSTLVGHNQIVNDMAWSPSGAYLATASADHTVVVWNPIIGGGSVRLVGNIFPIEWVYWSPRGKYAATIDAGKKLIVWNVLTGQGTDFGTGLTSFDWSPDGAHIVLTLQDGEVKICDTATGRTILSFARSAESADWSPYDARLAVFSDDGTARLRDPDTGRVVATLAGHIGDVFDAEWSPDGKRLAAAAVDGTARVWDLETGRIVAALPAISDAGGYAEETRWNRDLSGLETWWYNGKNGVVRVRYVGAGHRPATFTSSGVLISSVSWDPAGSRLAIGLADSAVDVWNPIAGRITATLAGDVSPSSPEGVAWDPDGTRLAIGSLDGTTRVWDPGTGRELVTFTGHEGAVRSVAWSPGGTYLATGSDDDTARIRSLPQLWPEQLCERAGRNLTLREWADVVADLPYRRQCGQWPSGKGAAPNAPTAALPRL